MTNLFEESPLLDDIRDGFLLDTTSFIDVLEGVKILCLLMLNDSDLRWREATRTGEDKKRLEWEKADMQTFPKAPLPTQRRRLKWKRLTSPSKSMG